MNRIRPNSLKSIIVRILMKMKLDNLAYKVSPSYYGYWQAVDFANNFHEGVERALNQMVNEFGTSSEELYKALHEFNVNTKGVIND